MNLDTRLKEILKDGVYFDHLDCSDECGNKDGELTAVDNIVAEIKAAVLESLPKEHTNKEVEPHPWSYMRDGWNACLEAVKKGLK